MGERIKINAKKPLSTKVNSAPHKQKTGFRSQSSHVDRILFLQGTIGNQAVQRLVKSGTLQTKLRIGQPGDKYEQEADSVADAIMQMPQAVSNEAPYIQRACPTCEVKELQRQPLEEEEEEELRRQPLEDEELQAKQTSGHLSEVKPNLESHVQSFNGGGQPLSENDRTFFEPRFGRDFSQVRTHTDTRASETAQLMNAKAFTIGQDVVFRAGHYAPGTVKGKKLLAHELTHVVQQNANTMRKESGNLNRNFEKRLIQFTSLDSIQCSDGCPPGLEEEISFIEAQIETLPEASTPERVDLERRLAWREALAAECRGLRPYTSTREDVLAQLKTEAMLHRGRIVDLSSDLANFEPISSSERTALDNERDSHREALIETLEARLPNLEEEIANLRDLLSSFPMEESPEHTLLIRYETEWSSHMQELRPLRRWRARRQINAIVQEIAEIDGWLAELPQVCSPDEPMVEELLSRKTDLESQQQRLVDFLIGEMVEYEQWDPRWGATRYGSHPHCTNIRQAGCGPTSLAIVLNFLFSEDPEAVGSTNTLEIVTPPETARYAETHGRVCNNGTAGDTMINNISTGWPGFEGRRVTLDEVTNLLRQANPIIFLCKGCTGRTRAGGIRHYGGHFMVLSSIDEAGETYSVLDPGRGERTDIETISRRELERHNRGFWWIYRR